MTTKYNFKIFSDRFRYLMDNRKISNKDIYLKTGISSSQISKWKAGNTKNVQRENAAKLVSFFACDLVWLETGQGKPFPQPQETDTAKTEQASVTHDNWTIEDMLNMTREVLESKTIFRPALAANVRAFHQAITNERDMHETLKEIREMRKENKQMLDRIAALEEMLRDKQELNGPKRGQA